MTFTEPERGKLEVMEPWQSQLVGQILSRVDTFIQGASSVAELLADSQGLMEAADLRMTPAWDEFYRRWVAIESENELLTAPWAPAGMGSENRLDAAVRELRAWAAAQAKPQGRDSTTRDIQQR